MILQWCRIYADDDGWNTTLYTYKYLCYKEFPIEFNTSPIPITITQEPNVTCVTGGLYGYNSKGVNISSFYLPTTTSGYKGFKTNFNIYAIGW